MYEQQDVERSMSVSDAGYVFKCRAWKTGARWRAAVQIALDLNAGGTTAALPGSRYIILAPSFATADEALRVALQSGKVSAIDGGFTSESVSSSPVEPPFE
jgi:hypothetical protein